MDLLPLCCGAVTAGFVCHLFYFRLGEHLDDAPKILLLSVFSPVALLNGLVVLGYSVREAATVVIVLWASFAGGLWTSMSVYRAWLHRLRDYPGPFIARISKFWYVWKTSDLKDYKHMQEWHEKYGDYVRTGPNEISIADPEIVEIVHGGRSQCKKSIWYNIGFPMMTLHQMRDKKMHECRRRAGWDQAFNAKSLRAYDDRVVNCTDMLLQQISSLVDQSVDVSKWMTYYTYDVMGEVAFSRSFDALKTGQAHFAIKIMHQNLIPIGLFQHTPWLLHIMTKFPAKLMPMTKFLDYCENCVAQRKAVEPEKPDVFHHLLREPFFGNARDDHRLLVGDSRLIITAGSDTTAAALTFALYHLASEPALAEQMRSELFSNGIDSAQVAKPTDLQHLPYLNAVIQETLRMHPPIPNGVFRDSPVQGLTCRDRYIPGNVTILTPTYAIQRSPKAYKQPNSFIPERWTTRPELVIYKGAFLTFGGGAYSCIGKQLAYMEMRTVLAKLVLEFEIKFDSLEDGQALLNETRDCFTCILAPLHLVFSRRKRRSIKDDD